MIEVLKQALEALEESLYATTDKSQFLAFEAIISLRQAIAELESQDGACQHCAGKDCVACDAGEQEPDYWLGYGLQAYTEKPFENATALYSHPPQRTEPKVCCQQYDTCLEPCTPRGEHLAQRTWVGLTEEEQLNVFAELIAKPRSEYEVYKAYELALKEKNT